MRSVIFDVGRVLVHWDPEATLAGLAGISQAGPDELRHLLQRISQDLGTGQISADGLHRLLIEQAGTTAVWERFYPAFCCGLCRDHVALGYVAQLARRGVPLGIISNTNAVHVQWLHAHLPELASFRSVVWSSTAGLLKPDRAVYELAVQQMGVDPTAILFVDDLMDNVAGAVAAGLTGCLHRDWEATRDVVEQWLAA